MDKHQSLVEKLEGAMGPAFRSAHRMMSLWLFGDVAYAILPLLVLAVITLAMNDSFADFGLLKEWSFASIVLYGTSVRRLIKLKVEIQNNPRSYKLDTGVQVQILLVIASVVILGLVVLREKRHLDNVNTQLLGAIQLLLFVLSITSIFVLIFAEEHATPVRYLKSGLWPRSASLQVLATQLDAAAGQLERASYLTEKVASVSFREASDEVRERVMLPHAESELKAITARLHVLTSEITQRVNTLIERGDDGGQASASL